MANIQYSIAKYLLKNLKDNGVDISGIAPKSQREIEFEQLRNQMIQQQIDISFKRSEIIELQNKLLRAVEAPIFSILGKAEDSWEKGGLTLVWLKSLQEINLEMVRHGDLLKKFEETYNKMKEFNAQKQK